MNSNEPDDTLLRLTLPLLEIDARSLPVSTEMFVKSLNEYINQEKDRTGLRLFSLIDQAKSLGETYQRIELILRRLDKHDHASSEE